MAAYAHEKNVASDLQYLPDSTALNLDGSAPGMASNGDVLSISVVCAICGIPVRSYADKRKMTAQRGYYVCQKCRDEET